MATGEPNWYTYIIGGGGGTGVSSAGGAAGQFGGGSGNTWTVTGGDQITWGGSTGGHTNMPAISHEELQMQHDFSKLGIPITFKSQAELTKEKLEQIREAMSKFIVVVEIEEVPSAVIPADKISELYSAIKAIVEK